jgi:hypothetical protein
MDIYKTYIAGVRYRKGVGEKLDALGEGALLKLEPEPTNEWDANAVKILADDGMHLGYVPAYLSSTVAGLIKAGRIEKCILFLSHVIEIYYRAEERSIDENSEI